MPAKTADSADNSIVTAGALVIGDEILSGRIREKNAGHLAAVLTAIGIDLREVRIVGDDEEAIIEAVNALRKHYTYVFTSGGIGPTHDDITADAIAKAFGLPCDYDAQALKLLGANMETAVFDGENRQARAAMRPASPAEPLACVRRAASAPAPPP
ncbi:molybdopterin-binding protein [uncultured Nitratireductor sp.]|uniref:molybdopterin-binding protein n=1 Tax=uncultured Nitratireductor sp. TaxID=520953 RepID=UPI0025D7EE11|nr:molybdopterin-binding protein [uncultured Nitratireductor sp.]